jgi:hypothetical protein
MDSNNPKPLRAVGVNIRVPIPIFDDLLGDSGTPHQHRWWFWVIIGVIGAFFLTAAFFTVRGFLRYRQFALVAEGDTDSAKLALDERAVARRSCALVGAPLNPKRRLEQSWRDKLRVKINPRAA